MRKKLTITVEEDIYRGLHKVIGPGKISRFVEDLVRPHVVQSDLNRQYEEMAREEAAEQEALQWSEEVIGDVADETG